MQRTAVKMKTWWQPAERMKSLSECEGREREREGESKIWCGWEGEREREQCWGQTQSENIDDEEHVRWDVWWSCRCTVKRNVKKGHTAGANLSSSRSQASHCPDNLPHCTSDLATMLPWRVVVVGLFYCCIRTGVAQCQSKGKTCVLKSEWQQVHFVCATRFVFTEQRQCLVAVVDSDIIQWWVNCCVGFFLCLGCRGISTIVCRLCYIFQ